MLHSDTANESFASIYACERSRRLVGQADGGMVVILLAQIVLH